VERRNASLQSDWTLGLRQVLTLGVDYLDDRLDSSTPYDATSRDNVGVFGQYKARFGAHEILGSVRNDDNEQFGNHTTGNLGWKWFLTDHLAVHAGWGSAFRAPSFNDLYYPGFSNPNLNPEESNSYEVGVSGTVAPINWSLTAFETKVDDMIAYDPVAQRPMNIDQARIRGAEAELRTHWNDLSVALGYTYLDPRSRTPSGDYQNYLPRRARHAGRLDINYRLGAFSVGTFINAQGRSFDDVANLAPIGSFAVVDLIGEYRFGSGWSVQGKVANAFDRDYETARYYYQDGRTWFVTVRYQPGQP